MNDQEQQQAELPARDFSGALTQLLIGYLQTGTPEGTLEQVLRSAGETRSAKTLSDPSSWSSYKQFRGLLESAAGVLGGPASLAEAGRHVYDSIQSPALAETAFELGSPAALYAALPAFYEALAPVIEMRTENTGPNECRFSIRFKRGYEPYPAFCSFLIGLNANGPTIFGHSFPEILVESCQCEGAEFCQAFFRWEPIKEDVALARRAQHQSRLSQARLEDLQQTVAELVSGDGLEAVLTRVVVASARAVTALSHVLAVKMSASSEPWLCTEGIDNAEGARIIQQLGGLPSTEVPSHMFVTEVASDRAHYGHLVVVRSETCPFEPHQRAVLESYARLAASALDSEAAIAEARQQTTTAEALLSLSGSLTDLGSTEDMVRRLAHAIPSVIDCDRACVWLSEPGSNVGKVSATYGFDEGSDARLRSLDIALRSSELDNALAYHHGTPDDRSVLTPLLVAAGSKAALSFPITYDDEKYGWITVDVTHHAERLSNDVGITERLRGLAGQAAIAIRNARLVEEIRHQSLHDSLTGLPNRALIVDRVQQAIVRSRREHLDVALLFIDLEDVNDTLGHGTGDELLKAVGARFAETLRESDTVGRLGGDEFVVVAEGLSLAAGPELVAERLLAVLAEPFHLGVAQRSVSISASIGIAASLRESAEHLFSDADIALYAAKEAGKNRYVVFEAEMQTALHSRHELEMDLQAAVGTDQFFLLYQPIFDLRDLSVVGVEALLRWHHPVQGLLQPDEFIPALESSGMIVPVGRWVLHEACRQAMIWRRAGHVLKMSVNASARQLDADSLLDDVRLALATSGLPADNLIIEITETSLMRNTKGAQKQLTALKSLGVRIAIDDFGTGYSSLSHLQQFPIDSLKIDRSFISGMAKTPEGDALIRTLMQLGKALHLETLAEGIEESGQLTQLQAESCDVGQGFLFCEPLPPEEVAVFFKPAERLSSLDAT